jgi:MFS-type transporter involved in bile tolerance (Atg22 family)
MNAASPAAARRPAHTVLAWLVLLLLAAVMLAMIVIPVYLIMPFKSQTPRAIDIAFTLKRWSPMATLFGVIITVALAVYVWRGARRFKRTMLVLLVALAALLTWFARQNHFEWMFKPLPAAAFANVSDTTFVNDADQVMAIRVNEEAAAYPIREMAYHHVVEDTVGGVPIVATY